MKTSWFRQRLPHIPWLRMIGIAAALMAFCVQVSYAGEGEVRPTDQSAYCFDSDVDGRAFVHDYLASGIFEEQRTALRNTGYDITGFSVGVGDIRELRHPRDSRVCAIFNKIFADIIAKKQIDSEFHYRSSVRLAEMLGIDRKLDPGAYAHVISYFRVGDFYFVTYRSTQVQFKHQFEEKEGVIPFASTAGYGGRFVYDSELNLIAANHCPGEHCSPDDFEEFKRKYSPRRGLD